MFNFNPPEPSKEVSTQVVTPTQIIQPTGETVNSSPVDPCPACGASPNNAPEATSGVIRGEVPEWAYTRCYKCGYTPGTNFEEQQRQAILWEAFQTWYASRQAAGTALEHPTVSTDNPGNLSIEERKAALEQQLADLNAQGAS